MLSGSWDRGAILWDLETGKIVQKYVTPEQGRIPFVAADTLQEKTYVCNYTSDVNLIKHNTINVFDLKTGIFIKQLMDHGVVKGNQTICCCRSDSKFYSGSDDFNVFEYDLSNGEVISVLKHLGPIKYIALNQDSSLLATATAQPDCAIRIFDTSNNNKLIGIIDDAFTDDITSVQFVNKNLIVASSFDASAKAFDLQNFHETKCYYGHDRDLWLCCVGFQDEVLVTGSLDGSCCFFDIDSQELIVRFYLLANNNYKDFLWVAPPNENNPAGDFFTNNPELIYVYRKGKSLDSPEVPVTEDEFQKYYAEHNNSSILNRLAHYSYYRNQLGKNGFNKPGFNNLQLPEHS
ncbi:MAG TPA: hypothetical protein PKW80_04255 [Bacteroidales bacterium]|nr:hypothetical protein [Bacteroidales bacterium]